MRASRRAGTVTAIGSSSGRDLGAIVEGETNGTGVRTALSEETDSVSV
jgi:hypothetical protein